MSVLDLKLLYLYFKFHIINLYLILIRNNTLKEINAPVQLYIQCLIDNSLNTCGSIGDVQHAIAPSWSRIAQREFPR